MYNKTQVFKRRERLKEALLFARLFKKGRCFKSANFSVRFLYNGINISRLGISISAKVFRKATQRNRIKRLVREVFRRNKEYFNNGYDIVIRPQKLEVAALDYSNVEKELLGLFHTAEMMDN